MILPGWGDLDATTRLHNAFEIAGIVFLALLVLTEVLAYIYGHRRDWLIEDGARVAGIERQNTEREAENCRSREASTMRKQMEDAEKNAAEARNDAATAKAHQAQRFLSEPNKKALIAALGPFAGQKVTITSSMGDADSDRYKQDFLAVLRAAKWSFDDGTDVSQSIIMPTPVGVQVTMNQGDAQAGRVLKSAYEFVLTLHKLGLTPTQTMFVSPQVPTGEVHVVIGTKPPTN